MKHASFRTLIAAGLVATVATGVATAGSTPRFELLGPSVHAFCDGTPIGESQGDWGHVVFSSPSNGTVSALVSLKNASPDAQYLVSLVDGGSGCYKADGTLTTNEQGNGSVRITEESTGEFAWVAVWGDFPTEQEFVAGVYEH